MDIEKVHEHCDAFEWREVTADRPLDCLHSPAIGDERAANAKWRPLGGAQW